MPRSKSPDSRKEFAVLAQQMTEEIRLLQFELQQIKEFLDEVNGHNVWGRQKRIPACFLRSRVGMTEFL